MTALLQAGSVPDVNQPILTENRESPLHIAAKHGHSGASAALIDAGANVDCRDRNGWTPLHLASRFGRIEVSKQQVLCVDRGGLSALLSPCCLLFLRFLVPLMVGVQPLVDGVVRTVEACCERCWLRSRHQEMHKIS